MYKNIGQMRKHLVELINDNFTDKNTLVTLTYNNDRLPVDEKKAKRDLINYIARLKKYREENELSELKYAVTIEKTHKGTIHHNLLIMDGLVCLNIYEALWGKGRVNATRYILSEEEKEEMARYMTKGELIGVGNYKEVKIDGK